VKPFPNLEIIPHDSSMMKQWLNYVKFIDREVGMTRLLWRSCWLGEVAYNFRTCHVLVCCRLLRNSAYALPLLWEAKGGGHGFKSQASQEQIGTDRWYFLKAKSQLITAPPASFEVMDANLLLFKHLGIVRCGPVATTTATLSGFRRKCA
jgi:hypothetical protein